MNARRMTKQSFEVLLHEVCSGATLRVSLDVDDAVNDDAIAVWHAAEVARGMLSDSYLPKLAALQDMRRLAERCDYGDEEV